MYIIVYSIYLKNSKMLQTLFAVSNSYTAHKRLCLSNCKVTLIRVNQD